jgi:hypothetical protein
MRSQIDSGTFNVVGERRDLVGIIGHEAHAAGAEV